MPAQSQTVAPDRDAQLLSCILDIGELLLTSGAEIMRVEDTMTRICHAYGFVRSDVFTITSSIVITVRTKEDATLTQTRRVYRQDINLDRVAKTNALSRQLCATPMEIGALQSAIAALKVSKSYPFIVEEALYIIVASAFCLFFGGTWPDAIAAAIAGGVLRIVLQILRPLKMNDILQCMLASFLTGLCVMALHYAGLAQHADKAMIGNIMLLIPGLLFTSSIRDMCNGDTLSGLLGICQSVLKAAAVAIGFAVAMLMAGGMQ